MTEPTKTEAKELEDRTRQYQMALQASAELIRKDMAGNLIQILSAANGRSVQDCQKEIANFLQNFTIPNAKFMLSVELNDVFGGKVSIVPEIQFKLELIDPPASPEAAN